MTDMDDVELSMSFYADYDYSRPDPYWDRELELQSRQIQRESDIRHGWITLSGS